MTLSFDTAEQPVDDAEIPLLGSRPGVTPLYRAVGFSKRSVMVVGGAARAGLLSVLLGVVLASPCLSYALRIDQFDGNQVVVASGPGALQVDTAATAGAAGGFRTVSARVVSGTFLLAATGLGVFSHSQAADVTAESTLIWDGDSVSAGVNPVGLGGIDLQQDGGDSFRLKVSSFDFPAGKPVSITITLFDASSPSGQKFSQGIATLNRAYSNEIVDLAFDKFTTVGPQGGADLSNIGAVTMLINGNNPAIDLELEYVGTNGLCDIVPVNKKVIDECGVCGGDNSTCADCNGVPNGPALPGIGCETGGVGACSPGTWTSACVCAADQQPSTESCDGIDNNCDGDIDETKDRCGICGGDGLSCLACTQSDISELLTALDGGAKEQEFQIVRGLRKLKKLNQSKSTRSYITRTATEAHTLQTRNWILSWKIPAISTQCNTDVVVCTTTSNEAILTEYRTHALELLKIHQDVMSRVAAFQGGKLKAADKTVLRLGNKQYAENLKLADQVPLTQSACTTGAGA